MGTSLDIKIKRANKVYHAGVSGGAGDASAAGGGAQARAVALGPQSRCGRALRTGQVGFGPGSLLMQSSAPKPVVTSGVATLERPAETRAVVTPASVCTQSGAVPGHAESKAGPNRETSR